MYVERNTTDMKQGAMGSFCWLFLNRCTTVPARLPAAAIFKALQKQRRATLELRRSTIGLLTA